MARIGSNVRRPVADCYEYIRSYYKVPAFAGKRVRQSGGREGVLVRKVGTQQYVWVRWDDEAKPRGPYHPTDVEYL